MRCEARCLLIVDDEPGIRSALVRMLRRDGYRILTAENGEQGLQLLATTPVQVILSDQRMPGMTGTEFLARAQRGFPGTVRIILSGYSELDVVTEAIGSGAVYKLLTKPWDDAQLRDQVRAAFELHKTTVAS